MASTITAGNATNNGTSISSDNTGVLEIKTGTGSGTTVMTLDAAGDVGIGTASPSYPLDVTGITRLNGVVGINGTPTATASLLVSQGGADFTLGTNYATFFSGNGYSGGIALNATSMQIGQNSASRSLTFHSGTSFAERMRIDASGNVGIGTSSPTTQLDLTRTVTGGAGLSFQANNPDTGASSASYILAKQGSVSTGIYSYGNSGSYIGAISNNFAAFVTNNTERMRIDTAGNVGIGTSAPAGILDVKGNTNGNIVQFLRNDSTGASANSIYQISAGTRYVNQFVSYSGQYFQLIGSGITSVFYDFDTQIWRNNAGTERMRLDSSGNLGIGLTPNPTYRLHVRGGGATSGTVSFLAENSSGVAQFFLRNDNFFNSAAIANYSVAGTGLVIDANNFVGKTTSSLRYKKDIVDYDKGLTALKLLRPVYYKSAVEGPNGIDPKQHAGFVAEEIADAGFEEFLVRDLEGRPDAIQYAHITALLVASIKELKAELDVCKAEIAALKGAK